MDNNSGGEQQNIPVGSGQASAPDTIYSSQDILGKSIAGGKKNFFTRIKKTSPDFKEHIQKRIKSRSRFSKKQIIIISVAILTIVLGITALVIILKNFHNSSAKNDDAADLTHQIINPEDPNEQANEGISEGEEPISEEEETTDITSSIDNVPEDVLRQFNERITTTSSMADDIKTRLELVKFLAENGFYDASYLTLSEINHEILSDCQMVDYYDAVIYLDNTRGYTANLEEYSTEMDSYKEKCSNG